MTECLRHAAPAIVRAHPQYRDNASFSLRVRHGTGWSTVDVYTGRSIGVVRTAMAHGEQQ